MQDKKGHIKNTYEKKKVTKAAKNSKEQRLHHGRVAE